MRQKNWHPANVINASFGFGGPNLSDPPYGPVLDVIGRVNRQGAIVVASSGNEGSLADRRLPGSASGVISVGASNIKKQSASFSNFGRTVDVLAPGEEILGLHHGQLVSLNGTSFSSPLVTGIASLMVGEHPMLSWKQVEYLLKETATPMTCDSYCPKTLAKKALKLCRDYCCEADRVICAKGVVNARKAVALAANGFPELALIDVDDYYLALSDDNDLKAQLVIKNWGRKAALVRKKEIDRHLHMKPDSLKIPPASKNGVPGLGKVTVFYDEKPDTGVVSSLILEASNSDAPQVFHDRIESIVEIVPDNHTARDRKILMELELQ
ncbi:MAG TPA: S8 family serine peptidase, partial [Myxococcota bacterium]|nr:S8 family serine peptidase [Myxococcota bacterium]